MKGVTVRFEEHHIAGRRNADTTIRLCVECHRRITNCQGALGVPLSGTTEETERTAAMILGLLIIVETITHVYARRIAERYGLRPDPRAGYRTPRAA